MRKLAIMRSFQASPKMGMSPRTNLIHLIQDSPNEKAYEKLSSSNPHKAAGISDRRLGRWLRPNVAGCRRVI
jgi:hypothetical protein